jgi:plasmid stabilization system protein ParE
MARVTTPIFAASALADLEAVLAYYAAEGVPEVGQRLVCELIAQVERLAAHPHSGRVVPEFGIEALREIIHPPFRIVYRADQKKVSIVRIWRSERLLKLP